MMTLNLPLLFVFDFALLNFSARNGHNARRQLFEFFKRRFFALWFRLWHVKSVTSLFVKIKLSPFTFRRLPSHFRFRNERFNFFRGSANQPELYSYPEVVQKIPFPNRYVTLAAFVGVNTRTSTMKTKSLFSNEIKQVPLRDHVRLPDEYQTEYRSEDFWLEKESHLLASNRVRAENFLGGRLREDLKIHDRSIH
jgi:hypothetical protein